MTGIDFARFRSMVAQVPRTGRIPMLFARTGPDTALPGRCISCGEPLRGAVVRCAACTAAAAAAVNLIREGVIPDPTAFNARPDRPAGTSTPQEESTMSDQPQPTPSPVFVIGGGA